MRDLRDPDPGYVCLVMLIVVGMLVLIAASPSGVLAVQP